MSQSLIDISTGKFKVPEKSQEEKNLEEAFGLITEICFGKGSVKGDQDDPDELVEAVVVMPFSTDLGGQKMCRTHFHKVVEKFRPWYVYAVDKGRETNGEFKSDGSLSRLGLKVIVEDLRRVVKESDNYVEDILNMVQLGLAKQRSIIFVTEWWHCGLLRLVFKKALLSSTRIYQRGYVVSIPGIAGVMSPDCWYNVPKMITLIMEEFGTIELLGSTNKIEYPIDIRVKVQRARDLLAQVWSPKKSI